MAINLKPVDVAVIGLGAAGGVAVLPLARAGLKVAGIEAGTWMNPAKDFKPDEIHNNVRSPGDDGSQGQERNSDVSHQPRRQGAAGRGASDDERRRRHVDSLSRAKLAAEAVGFQDALGNHQALRREFASEGIDAGGLAGQLRRTGAVLRHRGARGRRIGQGGEYSGQARSGGQCLRRPAAARISDASAAHLRFSGSHAQSREVARLEAVSRAGGDQFAAISRAGGVRVSRLLRSRRMPGPGEEFHVLHHHSRSTKDQEPDGVRQARR